VALIGGFVAVDGFVSILIQGGQHHGIWFDTERGVRALAGIILLLIALWRISGT
jgi:hypothetical protein